MQILKRDGLTVNFDKTKIVNAIKLASDRTDIGFDSELANKIADSIAKTDKTKMDISEIETLVENKLMASSRKDVAREYITFRQRRTEERLKRTELYKIGQDIIDASNMDLIRENANLNGASFSGKMSKFGSEYSKWYANNFILPKEIAKAVKDNYIYIHDFDQYALGTTNCLFVPMGELLKNGFSTGNGSVRPPNSIMTAMALVAIIFQSQQNSQFGGVGASMLDYDLEPFVKKSFIKHYKKGMTVFNYGRVIDDSEIFIGMKTTTADFDEYDFALKETKKECLQASESLIHNLNTMSSRAGGQIPFTSINYGTCASPEGRMVIESLLKATISGLGHGETPIFPIQIFKCKTGINQSEGDVNYDLFKLAIECTSKRLYPNFVNLDAPYNSKYYVEGNPNTECATMGCRTRVIADRFGHNHLSGKGNLSFNTINLVKLGIEHGVSLGKQMDIEGFYKSLNRCLDVSLDGLVHRFNIQSKQPAKASDFMMREGAWEDGDKLNPDASVGELLKHGTISIGFLGLAECMKALVGKHHAEDSESYALATDIVQFMRDYCDVKSERLNLNVSLFATPAEGLSGKFTKRDKETFGEIEGVTDREYYTNSHHVPVYYPIGSAMKIKFEAPFHEMCNAGTIGYIELDGAARNNVEALESIVKYALSQNMTYFSINHPIDRCGNCNYEGIIGSVCPSCGIAECDTHISRLRRVTGYLTGDFQTRFNSAKQAEVNDRIKHV